MHVRVSLPGQGTQWVVTLPVLFFLLGWFFSYNIIAPRSLWSISVSKPLETIHKCILKGWNKCFTVTQEKQKIDGWGQVVRMEERGEHVSGAAFVKVTARKQRLDRAQHIRVIVSKEWWSCFEREEEKPNEPAQCRTVTTGLFCQDV